MERMKNAFKIQGFNCSGMIGMLSIVSGMMGMLSIVTDAIAGVRKLELLFT